MAFIDKNPWSYEWWDEAAQAEYIRTKGLTRAMIRAQEAGNTVHGVRPPAPKVTLKPGALSDRQEMVRVLVHRKNLKRPIHIACNMQLGFEETYGIRFETPMRFRLGVDMGVDISNEIDDEFIRTFSANFNVGYDYDFKGIAPELYLNNNFYTTGVDMGVQVDRIRGIGIINMDVGVAERASFDSARLFPPTNPSLGYNFGVQVERSYPMTVPNMVGFAVAPVFTLEPQVPASMGIGLNQIAHLMLEAHTDAAFALGLGQQTFIEALRNTIDDHKLGVNLNALFSNPVELGSVFPAVGLSLSAALQRTYTAVWEPQIGASLAAHVVTRNSNSLDGSYRGHVAGEQYNSGNQTIFTGLDFGDEDPNRYIFVVIHQIASIRRPNPLGTGINIGGVTATILAENTTTKGVMICMAKVPTGGNANNGIVTCNWNLAPQLVGIGVYRVISTTGISIAQTNALGDSAVYNTSTVVKSGGMTIEGATGSTVNVVTNNWTFNNGFEDYDNGYSFQVGATINRVAFAASHEAFEDDDTIVTGAHADNGNSLAGYAMVSIYPKPPEVDITPSNHGLGVGMVATLSRTGININPGAFAVAATQGAVVQALASSLDCQFLFGESVINQQVINRPNITLGAAQGTRHIVIVIMSQSGSGITVVGNVSVGGVPFTKVAGTNYTGTAVCEIWYGKVPTGTTGNVVYEISRAATSSYGIYSVKNSSAISVTDTKTQASGTTIQVSQTLTCIAGGCIIGGSISASSWTSATNLTVDSTENQRRTYHKSPPLSGFETVGFTCPGSQNKLGVFVSFAP